MWKRTGLTAVLTRLPRWPVTTLHGSRRNALVASTELADLRRQQHEVDRFLAGLTPPGR